MLNRTHAVEVAIASNTAPPPGPTPPKKKGRPAATVKLESQVAKLRAECDEATSKVVELRRRSNGASSVEVAAAESVFREKYAAAEAKAKEYADAKTREAASGKGSIIAAVVIAPSILPTNVIALPAVSPMADVIGLVPDVQPLMTLPPPSKRMKAEDLVQQ